MAGPISILVWLLVFVIAVWIAFWIVDKFSLDPPVDKIVRVIVGIIALLVLAQLLFHPFAFPSTRL